MPSPTDPRETGSFSAPDQTGGFPPQPPPRPSHQRSHKRLIWFLVCGLAFLGVVLGFFVTGSLRKSQQQTGSTFTPGSYDSVNSRLFSKSSPWNVPIGTNVQLDSDTTGMVALLVNGNHAATLYRYGMPIYTSTASDPTYTVQDTGNDRLFESYQPIHIPDAAAPSPGSDHWMFIYDTTKNLIFEMWHTSKDGGTWTTQTGDVYSPTGDGVLQVDGSPQGGNGASYFGGVVTDADIERGYISHALSLASEYTSDSWRYPMNNSDGQSNDPDDLPMGSRIQLDPSVNCETLPKATQGEKMICQALETYGGYIRDTGGVALSVYFEGEDLKDPNRNPPQTPGNPSRPGGIYNTVGLQDGRDLPDIPWNKLRVLKTWNSFTPLSTSTAAALLSLDLPTSLSLTNAADLPYITRLDVGEDAQKKKNGGYSHGT